MDSTDDAILRELTTDARMSFRTLGGRVGLSANAAAARVRRMRADGVIGGFTIRRGATSTAATGLETFVDVRLREGVTNAEADAAFARFPEVLDAAHVTGPYDYLIHAVVPDAAGLDWFVRRLKADAGVLQTSTRIAMRPTSGR